MNILMLGPHSGVRGPVPIHTPFLVEGLRTLGVEVTLDRWGRHSDQEGTFDKLWGRVRDIRAIRRRLRADPCDLFIIKSAHYWNTLIRDIALLVASRGLRPAVILQFHGSNPGDIPSLPFWSPWRIATNWLMNLVDGALVLSTEEKALWERAYPEGRFEVVKNPFVPFPEVESPAETEHAPVFLYVGRLLVEKGIFDALEAFARLRINGPARLIFAGEGPAGPELKARVNSLGLADSVLMMGYLGPEELARTYARADVFLLPTYCTEGYPTAILEAMQAGLPVVTTDARGAADHLVEGEHVLYIPPQDPAALAAAMERLGTDRELRRSMGEANRKKLEEFSGEQVAREYRAALERILKDCGKA